jgi:hypothetical protein
VKSILAPDTELEFLTVAYNPMSDSEMFLTRHTTEQDGAAAMFWTLFLEMII